MNDFKTPPKLSLLKIYFLFEKQAQNFKPLLITKTMI